MKNTEIEELKTEASTIIQEDEYIEFINNFLQKEISEGSYFSDADKVFCNVGKNLISLAISKNHNYTSKDVKTAAEELKNVYQNILETSKKAENDVPAEIFNEPKYQFIRSITHYLEGLFSGTGYMCKYVLSGEYIPIQEDVDLCFINSTYDCIKQAHNIIENDILNDIDILGNNNNE